MRRELGIAERTYRKYRRVLREDFAPFVQRDGKTAVTEVETGGARFLRLVDLDASGVSDPEFDARVAAMYLAQSTMATAAGGMLVAPMNDLVAEFESGLRDRAFVQSRILDQADRMFVTETPPNGTPDESVVRSVIRSLVHRRELRAKLADCAEWKRLQPYTLVMGVDGLSVIAASDEGSVKRFALCEIEDVEVTGERFEYPSRVLYDPQRWLNDPC